MADKTRATAKRGRKPNPPERQLTPITIRLTPKLKYGLELLARAQHRSLSQAVEWALQVGLNSFEVGYELEPLGHVVDLAWAQPSESQRLLTIYHHAPQLLTFEERAACELVSRSLESDRFAPPFNGDLQNPKDEDIEAWKEREAKGKENERIYYEFVDKAWPAIQDVAARRANAGQDTHQVLLLGQLGMLMPGVHDDFGFMAELLPHVPSPFDRQQWDDLVSDVMRQYNERMESFRKNYKASEHKDK